jgi:hypothetical protein
LAAGGGNLLKAVSRAVEASEKASVAALCPEEFMGSLNRFQEAGLEGRDVVVTLINGSK